MIHENSYSDIPRGVFIVRGENVVLLGEIVRSQFAVSVPFLDSDPNPSRRVLDFILDNNGDSPP